jgi:hypothetical protein
VLKKRDLARAYGSVGTKIDAQANIHAGLLDHALCYRDPDLLKNNPRRTHAKPRVSSLNMPAARLSAHSRWRHALGPCVAYSRPDVYR